MLGHYTDRSSTGITNTQLCLCNLEYKTNLPKKPVKGHMNLAKTIIFSWTFPLYHSDLEESTLKGMGVVEAPLAWKVMERRPSADGTACGVAYLSPFWQNEVLPGGDSPSWRSRTGRLLGPPCRGDGESFLLGIRQEKRWICSELFHGTLWLDNAIRQLGAVAFSVETLQDPKDIKKHCLGHVWPSFSLAQRKLAFGPFF